MGMFEDRAHNDLISLVVMVEEIVNSEGAPRAYTLRVRTVESTSVRLVVWEETSAAGVDWQLGEWYKLENVLLKKWSSNAELHAANKAIVGQSRSPISDSEPSALGKKIDSQYATVENSTTLIHTTDSYLDRENMGRQRRQEDYLAVFEETMDYAQHVEADAILHTGNLFWSGSPSPRVIERCRMILERGASSDIDFYLLYGERDLNVQSHLSSLVKAGLITRLTPRWNQIGDIAIFAHDATVGDPEPGFHSPPDDSVNRIAAVYDDLSVTTEFSDVKEFENGIGWSFDAVLLGNQDERVETVEQGTNLLSPGPPERIIGKRNIDLESSSPRYLHKYDISPSDIDVQAYETSSRPVTGFRIELGQHGRINDIQEALPLQALEGTAAIFEIIGEKSKASPSQDEIQQLIAKHAAFARGYDERIDAAKLSRTGEQSYDENRLIVTGLEDVQHTREDNTVSESMGQTHSSGPDREAKEGERLTGIPGVGEIRAELLSNAGYDSPSQIADASIDDLASEENLNRRIAKSIRLGAREIRGDADTEIVRLAEQCEVDRADVADAHACIAYHLTGTFEEKLTALHERFSNEKSILSLEGLPIADLYSLYTSGFHDVHSVAQAQVDDLTKAPYLTRDRAEVIQDTAQSVTNDVEIRGPHKELEEGEMEISETEQWDVEMLGSASTLDTAQIQATLDYLMSEGCSQDEATAYIRWYLRDMLRGEGMFAVSGVGPSNGRELVEAGITDIDDLQTVDPGELSQRVTLSAGRLKELRKAAQNNDLRSLDSDDHEVAERLVDSHKGPSWSAGQNRDNSDDFDEFESESQNANSDSSSTKKYLEEIPGVATTRGRALRQAGYIGADAVASADVNELANVSKISNRTARCIHEAAKELCGYQNTIAEEMAKELDVDRDEIAEAYATLSTAGVPPKEAKTSLRLLFDDDQSSIFDLTQYSLRYRHSLFKNGFMQISDVAQAPLDPLTEAEYIGEGLAESIRDAARELVQYANSDRDTAEDTGHIK